MTHFLDLDVYSQDELDSLLRAAADFKGEAMGTRFRHCLDEHCVAVLMTKNSTRTRVSFEVAVRQLGGFPIFLSGADLQLLHGETIRDTALTLSRLVDVLVVRCITHAQLLEFSTFCTIPVINAMTDWSHPCQALADLLTMREHMGDLAGVRLVYVGAALNVSRSLALGASKFGMDVTLSTPLDYRFDDEFLALCREQAAQSGGEVRVVANPLEAAAKADFIYTDGWTPPEHADKHDERSDQLKPYQVNERLLEAAGDQARVMHCLPAHYGEEISEDIVHSSRSVVFDQVENRLYTAEAVLAYVADRLGDDPNQRS